MLKVNIKDNKNVASRHSFGFSIVDLERICFYFYA